MSYTHIHLLRVSTIMNQFIGRCDYTGKYDAHKQMPAEFFFTVIEEKVKLLKECKEA